MTVFDSLFRRVGQSYTDHGGGYKGSGSSYHATPYDHFLKSVRDGRAKEKRRRKARARNRKKR